MDSLSDKIIHKKTKPSNYDYIFVKDFKQAVKKLKEVIERMCRQLEVTDEFVLEEINSIFGEELTK